MQPITAPQIGDFIKVAVSGKVSRTQFQRRLEQPEALIQFLKTGKVSDWLEVILAKEREAHKDFFGQEFDLIQFKETLEDYGQGRIEELRKLGLEPHFFPGVIMTQEAKFPGWKVKPEQRYYQWVAKGKILRQQPDGKLVPDQEAFKLEGITVLIDTRLKPAYQNGRQMFKNDNLLGPIIERLRKNDKIAGYQYGPQCSRFGVSANEWEEHIKPELAELLGLEVFQVRLERAIEANVIPQLYLSLPRRKDGETDTWVWYEEYLGGRAGRLFGGDSDNGGLAHVYYRSADYRWSGQALRPLAVLGT